MNPSTQVPPGFRFHPTEEELVDYYLRRKVSSRRIDVDIIKEIDLYKIEPWDLQELCKTGDEEQNEWYFFSHKDKKYPTGTRTNRATAAGFWKATGRDKAIYCKHDLIGMRKTLVFYKGRAPNGQKSDWIMHEYRLETDENGAPQEEGWAVCRVFKKRTPTTMRRMGGHESPCWYDDQVSLMSELDSPQQASQSSTMLNYSSYPCKKEFTHHLPFQLPQDHLVHLPLFENSRMLIATPHATSNYNNNPGLLPYGLDMGLHSSNATMQHTENNFNATILLGSNNNNNDQDALDDQVTDWRVLDKFVASQLSQEDVAKGNNNTNSNTNNTTNTNNNNSNNSNNNNGHNNNYLSSGVGSGILFPAASLSDHLNKEDPLPDNSSTPSSGSQIDVWK